MEGPQIETPCIQVCKIDPASGLCTGCRRTLDEIMGWLAMTPEERRKVMARLPDRATETTMEPS
ncbi:hypothetical protein GCM10007276_13380 [Agaricicola taiwanensis]|uniref:DUF1289 domain-containing protein n=1 Tax=Agaricicola taiwanensis TaxID=591372 RepID=A0A8J2VPB1_9RHOB|nr:DUF1289 domain-containing protein [Agaricicola taiwanensis]GGE37268.1 hypothetical protein GCM10007276_13380 [Agaricicola taiwanensis]